MRSPDLIALALTLLFGTGVYGVDDAPAVKGSDPSAAPPEPAAPAAAVIEGLLTACATPGSSDGTTITVTPKGKDAQPLTLHITNRTTFTVNKAKSSLEAVHLSDLLRVEYVGANAISVTVVPPPAGKKLKRPPLPKRK
jgi:hypothetical protein